ncbi:twin transmembrane helix small protein [Sulfitobacter sp. HNIBRBA3233]|uniref:twin transmembrane helix small protein n=1 Tax=Sulfitobacter marinivivus TaxID=3158558 RepID=UPI0032DFFD30
MADAFFILVIISVLAVVVVLMFGLGGFAKGGKFNRENSNKLMRLRLITQFIAVCLIAIYVFFIRG